ncbi:hypothetical protein CDAR_38521 [Caerostris darwini]|uniref:Uncharacterized protein n=1 Tax=Caerostris darwini TaxID=1538125 RepID=A0AAV4UQR7_9ARAC|nr:hypothetical protein CDAR_38521 [Caerostris darwini]
MDILPIPFEISKIIHERLRLTFLPVMSHYKMQLLWSSNPSAEKSYQDVSIQPLVGDSPRGTANGRSIKSGRPPDYLSGGHRQSTPSLHQSDGEDIKISGGTRSLLVSKKTFLMNEEGEDIFLF